MGWTHRNKKYIYIPWTSWVNLNLNFKYSTKHSWLNPDLKIVWVGVLLNCFKEMNVLIFLFLLWDVNFNVYH
uniref:Uncharacterized protein n=1 Tax=Rhizophagus irregularis (strain DAOM 181602 / DAOM 197198 / MUCL 43194) TaxID=747089 RepID=U9U7I2_RHIID